MRSVVLDRSAYQAVVNDPYMTGPALLIVSAAALLSSMVRANGFVLGHFLATIGVWFLATFVLFLAGLSLTKKGSFTKTFRAVGFAHVVYVLAPLVLIPTVGPLFRLLLLILGFVTTWIGAATAHETRGWRTVVLPVIAYLILIIGYVIAGVLLAGSEFTVEGVLMSLGIQAP